MLKKLLRKGNELKRSGKKLMSNHETAEENSHVLGRWKWISFAWFVDKIPSSGCQMLYKQARINAKKL